MMRRSTALALVAVGAILALAVRVPLAFLDLKLTGLVLMIIGMIAGLTGLRLPQRAYRWLCARQEWLCAHQEQLTGAMRRIMEPPPPPGPRVPLDDLLQPEAAAGPAPGRG
jgi:hypothetical protein